MNQLRPRRKLKRFCEPETDALNFENEQISLDTKFRPSAYCTGAEYTTAQESSFIEKSVQDMRK